ncbi:conserved Plasmodium protein, unknown function [Plasmodium gallinaceum]|uniref:Uncharacterized protein n=1 Tax=Plasmodium gallinaceum TaxID=5849 RepID=A0A1J1H3K5_PLAGA|nr:conserved Plasmodium protein, unknown function [Plasmodium gallinaceum]CRG98071.1 conserved Plasmodium protein, unknown function [Plasmodium gallinaceum]
MLLMKIFLQNFFFIFIQHILLIQTENIKLKNYAFNRKHFMLKILNEKNILIYHRKKYLNLKQKKKVKRVYSQAYLVFDIIKIFGRISDKELLGHVISHNNEFIELDKNKKKKKWEILFDNNYINFDLLKKFLKNNKFEWPLTVNSGQIKNQGSINIPENCRKISEEFRNKNKTSKINLKIINDYVSELPISNDAIQCVFSSFSDFDDLTKDHFINKIHEWAPSDGIVDWYTFVYNLKEEPSDNIKRFFD